MDISSSDQQSAPMGLISQFLQVENLQNQKLNQQDTQSVQISFSAHGTRQLKKKNLKKFKNNDLQCCSVNKSENDEFSSQTRVSTAISFSSLDSMNKTISNKKRTLKSLSPQLSPNGSEQQSSLDQDKENQPSFMTLQDIISDTKSGIPSLQEEKLKQERVLKMKQKKALKLQMKQIAHNGQTNNGNKSSQEEETKSIQNSTDDNVHSVTAEPQKVCSAACFAKRQHTKKWTEDETQKFFSALDYFGTDFSLIARLFPTRSRKQIKNKFRKEEKENFEYIEKCLRNHRQMHMQKLQKKLKDIKKVIKRPSNKVERCHYLLARIKKLNEDQVNYFDIVVIEEIEEIFENQENKFQQL